MAKLGIERPTVFDPAIADRICERLATGENLRRFCVWPNWPTKRTVQLWAKEQPAFGVKMRKILRIRQAATKNSERTAANGGKETNTRDHAHAREEG
jgi:hypothetical protein